MSLAAMTRQQQLQYNMQSGVGPMHCLAPELGVTTMTSMSVGGDTEVQSFYRDCAVFVTGGTGFLGKLAMEKILRSCPGVRTVYVLIRPKKGLSVEQRKKVLLDNVVFERMKSEQPDSVEKIVFVAGDCSEPLLGLSDSDYYDLTQHVNIVLHMAATVRFDESFKTAVDINVKGTMEVINLCRNCVSLKAAVLVSTAYSNCPHDVIKEEFYEPPMSAEDTLALLAKFTKDELDILREKVMDPWPNTYVFSKAISENAVLTHAKDIPVVIMRPGMVVSTFKEPIPYWLDNQYGPISIVVGVGLGVLRVSYTDAKAILDLVPADMVVNCMLVSALTATSRSEDVPIYTLATSDNNPVTIRKYSEILSRMVYQYPLRNSIWYPIFYPVSNFMVYMFLAFFMHFLPGCALDLIFRLKGKPPMMLKLYRKIHKHLVLTNYFTKRNIISSTEKSRNLYKQLSAEDKVLFPFDTTLIDWDKYIWNAGKESRKYLLNELPDDLEAKSRNRMFYLAHTAMKIILFCIALYVIKCLFLK